MSGYIYFRMLNPDTATWKQWKKLSDSDRAVFAARSNVNSAIYQHSNSITVRRTEEIADLEKWCIELHGSNVEDKMEWIKGIRPDLF